MSSDEFKDIKSRKKYTDKLNTMNTNEFIKIEEKNNE
jgi:hypothetical protein